jgi:hypothetical protein
LTSRPHAGGGSPSARAALLPEAPSLVQGFVASLPSRGDLG